MITGYAHTAFYTTDMKRSIDYYVNILGCAHAFTLKDDQGRPWIEYLSVVPGQFIELFYTGEKSPASVQGTLYSHICFQVDDAKKTLEEIAARGGEIWRPLNMGKDGNLQFWLRDPDGNPIEFMQILPDSLQARS